MPDRASTDEEIASRALVMIGAKPLTSFGDGTVEATAAATIYEDVVTQVMTVTRWRFASQQVRLNKLSTPPAGRWSVAWQLPSDLINIIAVSDPRNIDDGANIYSSIRFDRYADKLYTGQQEDLILDYIRRVPTANWPPYFVLPVIHQLASELAIAVAQNEALSDLHAGKYNVFMAQGKTTDAQGRTNNVLDTKAFLRARR